MLFISHSSDDLRIVEALVDLFRSALAISPGRLCCSSLDGYRLPAGVSTDEQLRREVHAAEAFVCLISPCSLQSMYVMFELGARWGTEKHLIPLLAPGVAPRVLQPPLSALNALSCESAAHLHQLVADLATALNVCLHPASAYQREVDRILTLPSIPAEVHVPQSLRTELEQDFRKRKARLSEDSTSNPNKLQQVPTPVIDLDARFEPSDGPEGLRPAAVDIADRVARSIQPYFEVRIRAIEFVQEEITVLERVIPRSETENRKLAGLKTRLQWLVQKRELFSRAIEVVSSNVKIRGFHKVLFDDRTISDIILGLRDWIFIGLSGSGEYEWCLSKVGYPLQVSFLISEAEHRRMFTGMFVGDQSMRTLAQIQEQEGHFPLEWLDSDMLFRKAVPAIIVAVLQYTELGSSSDKIEDILDWPAWQVLLRSPNR